MNETPIFVLGNQKSGTTAIAVLLAERAGLSVDCGLTIGDMALVVGIYQEETSLNILLERNRLEFSRDVIKDSELTFLYPHLQSQFPHARFAHVIRNPRSNIRSILDRLSLPGDKSRVDQSHYVEMTEEWRRVVDGSWMEIDGENHIDRLAARWRRSARTYLQHEDNIELIRYEDFVRGKVSAIDDLVSRLGEESKDGIEEKVDQQFQPRGDRRDADWLSIFGRKNLERIESQCSEEMRAPGYTEFWDLN